MNSYKKKKLKKAIKEKWIWFVGTGLFLVGGLVALLIGFYMTGWSIIDWLKSPYATTFFVIIGVGLICGLCLVVSFKNSKLGGYNNE